MSLLIWTLFISIALIIALIWYKNFENSKGGVIFAPVFRNRINNFIEYQTKILVNQKNIISETVLRKVSEIPHYINIILHKVWRKVSKKIDGYFERLRGHRNIVKTN
jgi:hypothetical protein